MYIGVDIGASKTLVASFSAPESMLESEKFKTPTEPGQLITSVFETIAKLAGGTAVNGLGIAVPGYYHDGLFTNTTTLNWQSVPLHDMVKSHCSYPFKIANDAVLGGLAEARIGHGQDCINLLYITISTGVGTSIIIDGQIPEFIPGSEGGHMIANRGEKPQTWEELISGTAFKRRFGKFGYEVSDPAIWDTYASDLASCIYNMAALIEPNRVVLSGGMAVHFDRFQAALNTHLAALHDGVFPLPEVKVAKYPELAPVYGCAIIAGEA
ncbi:MAG: ROK family protein [Candidatus Saccharimonadales bacterium]